MIRRTRFYSGWFLRKRRVIWWHMPRQTIMQYTEKAENDDDIASFFVPLEQSNMGSLSFFQCGRGTFARCTANGLKNKEKEGSAIEQMKAFAKWNANEDNHCYGYRVGKLDLLIKKLEAKSVKLGIAGRS